jgi:DNA-binding LacI/PurR family transcriptional regulator
MARPPEARKKARDYLLRCIATGAAMSPAGISALAKRAGVAYMTMWKAVRELKASGKLHGSYRISTTGRPLRSALPRALPHVRLAERIAQDLLAGSITRGFALLSVKELTARYATSPGTLRNILADLSAQGLITPRGRHYTALVRPEKQRRSIVLIAYMQYFGALTLPQIERDFLRACESVCLHAQATLIVMAARPVNGITVLTDTRGREQPLPARKEIAGYIYLLQNPQAWDERILRQALAARRPLAILDNGGDNIPGEAPEIKVPRVCVFNASAHGRTGAQAAAYLLSKGHRHAAYISPFHGDSWSQVRYAGAARVFEKAGAGSSITLHSLPYSMKDNHYWSDGMKHSNGQRLDRFFTRWRDRAPDSFHAEADTTSKNHFGYLVMAGEIAGAMRPLLDEAASSRRVTAWIMANDLAARIALRYCGSKGIEVPERIAIIGFDDEIESTELRITSYNFNFDAAASAMVNFIMHPESDYWQRRKVVEIEGRIVERMTA